MYSNVSVSSLSMMLISINRFVGIYFSNIMDKIFTPLKSWLSVLGLWAFSFIIMSLPLAEVWGQYGYVKGTFSCTLLEKNGHTPLVFFSILIIGIPCLVILICYSLILYKVRSTGRAMRFLTQSTDAGLDKDFTVGSMTRTRERELTKTFGIICLCYIISFIPVSILSVFDPMPPCWENPGWHVFGYVMFWCSAIINPIVYILANRHYRKYFIYYVQRLFCMNPADPTTTLHSATYKPTPQSSGRVPRKEYPSLPRERKPRHEHQESLEMEPFRNQESVEQVQRFEPSQPIAPPLYENVATRSPKGSLMVTDIWFDYVHFSYNYWKLWCQRLNIQRRSKVRKALKLQCANVRGTCFVSSKLTNHSTLNGNFWYSKNVVAVSNVFWQKLKWALFIVECQVYRCQ